MKRSELKKLIREELKEYTPTWHSSKNFIGVANTGEKVDIEQRPNGMYIAQLKDKYGSISTMTGKTMAAVNKWLHDSGIKTIKWDDGKTTKISGRLKEFSMTHDSLNMIRKDILEFVKVEHKKLGYSNIFDTYNLILEELKSPYIHSKTKGIK